MSRIIDLNNKLNNRAYNFYCLDSHGELTFILEQYDRIIYANIYNVMVTNCIIMCIIVTYSIY